MNIPSEDVIRFLLPEILGKGKVKSQAELADLLNKRLNKKREGFSVSPARARKIALTAKGIKSTIAVRKGKVPRKCPSCGYYLKKNYTKNLKGKKLLHSIGCKRCPYRGRSGRFIPSRYEFWL